MFPINLKWQRRFHIMLFQHQRRMHFFNHGQAAEFVFEEGFVIHRVRDTNLEHKVIFTGEVQNNLHSGSL